MTTTPVISDFDSNLEKLLDLGTSTVYEGSGLECWVDPAIRPMWRGARVAGPAFTARTAPGENLAAQRAVREAPEGSVLVVDAGGLQFGHWGGMLTEIAILRGIRGLVINGTVRDIDELERLAFPVFATGIAMRHAGKRDPGEVGQPIQLRGREIACGDVIVADTDGVISIPRAKLSAALDGGLARFDKELERLATIHSGVVPPMTEEKPS